MQLIICFGILKIKERNSLVETEAFLCWLSQLRSLVTGSIQQTAIKYKSPYVEELSHTFLQEQQQSKM